VSLAHSRGCSADGTFLLQKKLIRLYFKGSTLQAAFEKNLLKNENHKRVVMWNEKVEMREIPGIHDKRSGKSDGHKMSTGQRRHLVLKYCSLLRSK
jgi:hypothetical protein